MSELHVTNGWANLLGLVLPRYASEHENDGSDRGRSSEEHGERQAARKGGVGGTRQRAAGAAAGSTGHGRRTTQGAENGTHRRYGHMAVGEVTSGQAAGGVKRGTGSRHERLCPLQGTMVAIVLGCPPGGTAIQPPPRSLGVTGV